jgi:ribosomal protein S18 acetylase RimI-like enzyme
MIVRALGRADLPSVAARVGSRLTRDAKENSLINPSFRPEEFEGALFRATDQTWVAKSNGRIVGHLFGALLDSSEYGLSAWIGPDGVSFDSDDVLTALYREANSSWSSRGAQEHFVWAFDADADTRPWCDLGFRAVSRRGVMPLSDTPSETLSTGYVLRRGGADDLELAVVLDQVIDEAQSPDITLSAPETARAEWRELLEDDEVTHYIVEFEGEGVAQCVTYPLSARRGSYDRTVHVSAVAVLPEHQHHGVARAMVATAMHDAQKSGDEYAETNWRVTNERAHTFWRRYGFRPTYVQLRRTSSDD